MKFSTPLALALSVMGLATASPTSKQVSLRFLTYNVRYDSKPNDITVQQTIDSLPKGVPVKPSVYYSNTAERPWSERRIGVANDILFPNVDIFGAQEVLKRQVDDLQELLGEEWDHIGVGRDDGKEAGEYSAIFYKKASVKLLSWDTFWLSSTPFEPSKFPGAGSFRACTRALFSSPQGGKFTLLNSHLDDQSDAQRQLGASLMLHRAKYESISTKRPVFLTGDFNSISEGATAGAYKITTGVETPLAINETFVKRYSWGAKDEPKAEAFKLRDLAGLATPERQSGNFATFTGFRSVADLSAFSRIDYLFGGAVDNEEWSVKSYHAGTSLYDNGSWNSDHRPVYSDISLRK